MDLNSAAPDRVVQLPFHGMSRYPPGAEEQVPSDAARLRWLVERNTRRIDRQIPAATP